MVLGALCIAVIILALVSCVRVVEKLSIDMKPFRWQGMRQASGDNTSMSVNMLLSRTYLLSLEPRQAGCPVSYGELLTHLQG